MILEDSVNIFIYSKMKQRIKRLMELEPEEGINEKDMEMKIRAVDRKRRIITSIILEIPGEEPRIIIFAWTAV